MQKIIETILKEAKKAYAKNEIPVGAVITKNNKIIAKGRNDRQTNHNILGHAEINAIINAEKKIKDWRLDGYDLYVTLEPCEMCETIIKESRIDNVYYLISQKNNKVNKKCIQISGYDDIKIEYKNLLEDFFKKMRQ